NDRTLGYDELLPIVEDAVPRGEEFIILGESFSGPLAVMLAAKQPPELRGVILCASFVRSPVPRILNAAARWFGPLLIRVTPHALTCHALLGRFQTPALRDLLKAALNSVPAAVIAARLRSVLSVNVEPQLRACSVPLLYLQVSDDRLVSSRCVFQIQQINPTVEVAELNGPICFCRWNRKGQSC